MLLHTQGIDLKEKTYLYEELFYLERLNLLLIIWNKIRKILINLDLKSKPNIVLR
jgi:hypothetical protein